MFAKMLPCIPVQMPRLSQETVHYGDKNTTMLEKDQALPPSVLAPKAEFFCLELCKTMHHQNNYILFAIKALYVLYNA